MHLAKIEETEKILEYLGKNVGNCVYLYMDICKYGLDDRHIRVWVNDDEILTTVVMRYFDSLQIYADIETADMAGIYDCIRRENVRMISCEKQVADMILINDEICMRYASKDGSVFLLNNYREFEYNGVIEYAHPDDCYEIAHLICMDEGFAENYHPRNLEVQLRDRMETGMGRSYIIRKDCKIIAHIATFAECAGIAVTSGLIVDPNYRDYCYGAILESYLVNVLKKENFQVYTFVNEKKRIKLLKAIGANECGRYVKLTKK